MPTKLEKVVLDPVLYAKTVERLGNEEDTTVIDLTDILPQAKIMVISISASSSTGDLLTKEELKLLKEAVRVLLQLDKERTTIVKFVESKMSAMAPNLSAVVGSEVAAQLIAEAGGLAQLSQLPSSSLKVLGSNKKTLLGMSTLTTVLHGGFIVQCDLIQKCPQKLRQKAINLLSGKAALAIRVDTNQQSPTGAKGRAFYRLIEEKIEKWQEPPPGKSVKARPVPDAKKKKRRGGERARRLKAKYAVTDMRKYANRVAFGTAAQEEYRYSGVGFGMLGSAGLKLRLTSDKKKKKAAAQTKSYTPSGIATGVTSSFAITPAQGLELAPSSKQEEEDSGISSTYFSNKTSFKRPKPASSSSFKQPLPKI